MESRIHELNEQERSRLENDEFWVTHNEGLFAVIVLGRLFGIDSDKESLLDRADQQFPDEDKYYFQIKRQRSPDTPLP